MAFTIGCVVFPLNYFHKKSVASFQSSLLKLNDLHILLLKDLKITSEFIYNENSNPEFFITGESPYLFQHKSINDSIKALFSLIKLENKSISPGSNQFFENIETLYSNYNTKVDSLVYLIYKRGYRDFGLVGEMISYIYQLEKKLENSTAINEIRINEREYLSRNDTSYATALNNVVNSLILDISLNNHLSLSEKSYIIVLLKNYKQCFNWVVALDSRIGLKNKSGLKSELITIGESLENSIVLAQQSALNKEKIQTARLNLFFGIVSLILLIAATLSSLYLSKRLVSHLELLTQYISDITKNELTASIKFDLRNSSSEIRKIYKEFRNMVAQIKIRENQRDRALFSARESELRYRELAELLPQSIFETDRLGNLVYANKWWFKDFGYTPDDLKQGINLIEIINTNTTQNLFEKDKIEGSDYIAIRKDKTRFPASVYADKIFKDDKFIGKRGIIVDSTLRNKYIETLKNETQRAINSDKHKSSFLANMSHEIRTPMNSIIGFANLLSSPQVPDEHKVQFVQYIQSSGQILLNLIDDIIDVAKIEAGEIKLKQDICSPHKIIKELVSTFEGYKQGMGKESIQLQVKNTHNELTFKTDSFRVRQIMSNLISNAIKFTEKGSVTVSVEVIAERAVRFSVEDTGVGLTKEELNTIFERFKRTKNSESKNIAGTGLGLSISKNLVELLGGQMWVSSEPGVGTKFWFELPYIRIIENNSKSPALTSSSNKDSYNWSDRTFLIAEDDDNSYVLLKEILIKTGARLVRAINGKEVVEAVKFSEEIDLILMDIQMPYQNGFESTRQIKELNPHIPVIAQTALAMQGDKEKSILAGCDDYISKPIQPEKLLCKISQFLKDKDTTTITDTSKLKINNQNSTFQINNN